MASTLKLSMEDLYEEEYQLIAIHTSLEDYRLAYFLNQTLSIKLKKCEDDLHVKSKKGEANFTRFEYEQTDLCLFWNLIQNKSNNINNVQIAVEDLFSNDTNSFLKPIFLLPEFKNIDFLLKLDQDLSTNSINGYISKINSIDKIKMVYAIDKQNIKTKNNLIF